MGADAERYRRVKAIVVAAWERPPTERAGYLDQACGGDAVLRAEVESLLAGEESGRPSPLDRPLGGEQLLVAAEELRKPGADLGAHMGADMGAGMGADMGAALGGIFEPGRLVGGFQVVRLIARGGMGAVYEAEQQSPRRRVALKVLRRGWITDELLRRFLREAEVLGSLHHGGIAQVYSSGTVDVPGERQPYIAMELVDGRSLTEYAAERRLDVPGRLQLLARVCDAVQHAHDRGVIHRDLKPANILITEDGTPKVLDFGIARLQGPEAATATLLTEVGQVMGTLPYMSPEQVSGRPETIDGRSDVYSLGVLLYELLGGRRPLEFGQAGVPEAVRRIAEEDPTRLGLLDTRLRGDVETIVGKALEKDPRRRYASASALADDIRRYLGHEPIEAHPPSALYHVRKFARRHRGFVGGLVVAFVALAVGLGLAVRFGVDEARQRSAAEHALYRLSLEAASAAWRLGAAREARQWLDGAPPALRGWEWDHLDARLHAELWSTPALHGAYHRIVGENGEREAGDYAARVDFSPDGGRVLALRDLRTLGEWDADSGRPLRSLGFGQDLVPTCLAVSAGRVAVADVGRHLWVIDRADWRVVGDVALPGGARALAWHPDGTRLAVGVETDDGGGDAVLVGPPGALEPFARVPGPLYDLQWSPALGALLCAFDPVPRNRYYVQALLFDEATGAPLFEDPLPLGESFRFAAADTGRIVSGTIYRTVQALDLERDVLPAAPRAVGSHAEMRVVGIDTSPDGRTIASATGRALRVWDADDGTLRVEHLLPDDGLDDIALSPDGRRVVVLQGGRLAMFATEPRPARAVPGPGTHLYWCDVSPDGHAVYSQDFSGNSVLWDPASARKLAEWGPEPDRPKPPYHMFAVQVAFAADDERLVSLVKDEPFEFDLAADTAWRALPLVAPAGEDASRWAVLAGPGVSSHRLAVSPRGGCVLDLATGRLSDQGPGPGPAVERSGALEGFEPLSEPDELLLPNRTASFSPDGCRVVVAQDEARVNAVADGALLATLAGHDGQVHAAAWSPDGTRIATGGNDATVRIWDAERYEPLLVLHGHQQYVHDLAWSPDGRWLVSAGGDGTLCIWDSVPEAERHAQVIAEEDLEDGLQARVTALFGGLADAQAVADALRAAPDLDVAQRQAALRLVRERVSGD